MCGSGRTGRDPKNEQDDQGDDEKEQQELKQPRAFLAANHLVRLLIVAHWELGCRFFFWENYFIHFSYFFSLPEISLTHGLAGSGAAVCSGKTERFLTIMKTVGTKNRVPMVAQINPPITARPRGAFCSPPS